MTLCRDSQHYEKFSQHFEKDCKSFIESQRVVRIKCETPRRKRFYDVSSVDSGDEDETKGQIIDRRNKKIDESKPMSAQECGRFLVTATHGAAQLHTRIISLRARRTELLKSAEQPKEDIDQQYKEYEQLRENSDGIMTKTAPEFQNNNQNYSMAENV